jgi:hypothetical protein
MTKVTWKWEDEGGDGEGVGPVWIDGDDGSEKKWEQWVRRSVAEKYAKENGYDFFADE